jgi:hypothetical protein
MNEKTNMSISSHGMATQTQIFQMATTVNIRTRPVTNQGANVITDYQFPQIVEYICSCSSTCTASPT